MIISRLYRKIEGCPNVLKRGRVPVFRDVVLNEVQDLVLAVCQFLLIHVVSGDGHPPPAL